MNLSKTLHLNIFVFSGFVCPKGWISSAKYQKSGLGFAFESVKGGVLAHLDYGEEASPVMSADIRFFRQR